MAYYNGKKVLSLVAGGTGSAGLEIIDLNEVETIPSEYNDKIDKCVLNHNGELYNCILDERPDYYFQHINAYYNTIKTIHIDITDGSWNFEDEKELTSSTNIVDITSWIEAGKVPEEYRDTEILKSLVFSYNGFLFFGSSTTKTTNKATITGGGSDVGISIEIGNINILTASYYGDSQWSITYGTTTARAYTDSTTYTKDYIDHNKQDKLTAGENITIEDDGTISAEGEPPITIVDTLPEANEENYLKGKIYTQGELLEYISKVALSEPNIFLTNNLPVILEASAAAAVGTNIYIFGGYDNSNYRNTIYKFDTISNSITTLSTVLPSQRSGASAVSIGTNIYIFGGRSSGSGYTSTIYKFNTTNETITTLSATLPRALSGIAISKKDNFIYLFGGEGSSSPHSSAIYKFDTTNETITTLTTTLETAIYDAAAAAVGTNIYIFGGYGDGSYSNKIYQFNTNDETISTLSATLPTGIRSAPAVLIRDNVFIIGGLGTGVKRLDTIYKAEFGFTYQYKTITAE